MLNQLPFSEKGVLLNIPAFSTQEANALLTTCSRHLLFAVTAYDNGLVGGIKLVEELKGVAPVISVALGGDGDASVWKTALEIGKETNGGHLNQPILTAPFAQGQLPGQLVNGLFRINSDGTLTITWLEGQEALRLSPRQAGRMAREMQLGSIKLLGVGKVPMAVFERTIQDLAREQVPLLELAGGLKADNITGYVQTVIDSRIKVIPHVFGAVADFRARRVDIEKIGQFAAILGL